MAMKMSGAASSSWTPAPSFNVGAPKAFGGLSSGAPAMKQSSQAYMNKQMRFDRNSTTMSMISDKPGGSMFGNAF